MIKAVTFDVFGTLFDWRGGCREYLQRGVGLGHESVEELLNVFRERQFLYMLLDNCLGRGMMRFTELTRLAFLYASEHIGFEADEETVKGFVDAWRMLPPYEDSAPALGKLKMMGYRIFMLSNGDRDTLVRLAERLGGVIDGIVSSDDAGVYKPSPAIYEAAIRRIGVNRDEIMHVAGSYIDVVGSSSAGLTTLWINRQSARAERYGPAQAAVIKSLMEVPSYL